LCCKGSVDRVKKIVLLHAIQVLENHGKHPQKVLECPGKPPEMFGTNTDQSIVQQQPLMHSAETLGLLMQTLAVQQR